MMTMVENLYPKRNEEKDIQDLVQPSLLFLMASM
jgi:hypothetical protein